MRFWPRLSIVFAVGFVASGVGCTSILGNFSSADSVAKEAGTEPDATTGQVGANADGSAPGSPSEEAGGGGEAAAGDDAAGGADAASAGDSAGGCGAAKMECAAGCVSLSDVHTCGNCTTDCTTLPHVAGTGLACTGGVCAFTCNPGSAHCSANPADGCETDLSAVDHCGACKTACDPDSGTPVCALSGATYACASGCMAGTTLCSGSCADLTSSNSNCGACGNACTGGMTCQASGCACAPLTNCGGTCFETDDDPIHCGASCTVCPVPTNGTATCAQGTCGTTCTAGYSACGGATPCAYDTNIDPTHCGSACAACSSGEICTSGTCRCPSTEQDCGGTCTNVTTNSSNCGTCGNICSGSTPECTNGVCTCGHPTCSGVKCPGCGDCTKSPTGAGEICP
jgi:hypothetical protein